MRRFLPLLVTLLVVTAACIEAPTAESGPLSGAPQASPAALPPVLPTVTPTDLRFGGEYSTPVISSAQKFVLPVGPLGEAGEPLVYPPDHSRAGQPILDYQGQPIGDLGLVFFNEADQSVQAVAGDGQGVIIINEVSPSQALALYQRVADLSADPSQLTLDQLKQVLAFAQDSLGLGDRYNSTRDFIQTQMSPVQVEGAPTQGDGVYGFKKRDSRDINQAIYIPGAFRFAGPAASPQVFEQGGVMVQQQDSVRGVQPDIFIRTYSHSDGRPIVAVTDLARLDLATQTPRP